MSALSKSFNEETASATKQDIDAFWEAARFGDSTTITQLLDTYGQAIINTKNSEGSIALIGALEGGQFEVVYLLLERGADVNAQDNKGRTALMEAAYTGESKVVSALLKMGADIEAQNNSGDTAMILAARGEMTAVETLLLHEQSARKQAAEIETFHSGINQEVRAGSRLLLRPARGEMKA